MSQDLPKEEPVLGSTSKDSGEPPEHLFMAALKKAEHTIVYGQIPIFLPGEEVIIIS
jgi:hypothetical protein